MADDAALVKLLQERDLGVLATLKRDGRPQLSNVNYHFDAGSRLIRVSITADRAKARNLRRDPRASVLVLSDDFGGAWVQVDGTAEVLDLPEALEPLVEYFRVISGEHPDWDEYRQAMREQGKSLIRITVERWGPVATGGFPARLA
jgi:PPOX class probable F420-dependent enzyme